MALNVTQETSEKSEYRDRRQNHSPGKRKDKKKQSGCQYMGSITGDGACIKITSYSHGRGFGHVAVCPVIPVCKALREEMTESAPCHDTDSAMFYAGV